mgnify:CR=1 FL=1
MWFNLLVTFVLKNLFVRRKVTNLKNPKEKLNLDSPRLIRFKTNQGIITTKDMANISRNMSKETPSKRERTWFVGGAIKLGIASVIVV